MFDVFLSYNSRDKAAVEVIANRLRAAGIEPFLDRWHLVPGEKWQPALEKALEASKTVAVFIGPSGISPWHNEELRVALSAAARTRDDYRVIPVLLPEASEKAVTGFLELRTWVDFRNGLDKEEPFQRLVTGVKGVARVTESFTLPDEPAPYRGLLKFEQAHADRFFGREGEIVAVLQRLERSRFVAVFGASGTGKSSLVLAGVLPRLERLKSWAAPITTFVLTPGSHPLRALADRAVALLPPADRLTWADRLEERMLQRTDGLRSAVETWTAVTPGTIVLVVDQLEELFTHADEKHGTRAVEAFAGNLLDAVESSSGKLRVLATIRSEFFDRCLRVEPLRALIQDRTVLLGRMTVAGLRDAITHPAAAVGAYFETGVVSALMKELERRPTVLPLLQHALELLWRARKGVWLTSAAYDAMGGVAGALKKHADHCWSNLSRADQALGRDILLRFVSLGDGVPDTTRRVTLDELYAIGTSRGRVNHVLQSLSGPEARLLVIDGGADRAVSEVEVAHEILIQEWLTFRTWVDSARRKLRIHRRVTEAAREWADNGRASGYLLTGARLLEAEESFGSRHEGLNQLEADFLHSSIEGRKDEDRRKLEAQQARARVLLRSLVAVGGLAIAAAVAAGIAITARTQVEHEKRLAHSRELAGTALRELGSDPQAALLLIQEAYRAAPSELVTEAMYRYRAQLGRVAFKGHLGWVTSAAFSPDGLRVVTTGEDDIAHIWDATNRKEMARFVGHQNGLSSAAFSPDGLLVVTAGEDGTARIWNAATGQQLMKLEGHSPTYHRYTRPGRTPNKLESRPGGVWSAAFSADGLHVVTAGADGTARIWSLVSGKELAKLEGHSGAVWCAAVSPDGLRLVTAGEDGTVRVWDTISRKQLAKLEGHSGGVWSAAFSPDGLLVATAGEDGTVRIWDAATGKHLGNLEGHSGGVWSASFSSDGLRIVTGGDDGTARIWDTASHKELVELDGHTGIVRTAAFSADGLRVVTASQDGTARIWDVSRKLKLIKLKGHGGVVRTASFSPDGLRIVTASYDGTARVWDTATGLELAKLEGHTRSIWGVAFSPDGLHIATASEDGTARIWDAANHTELVRFEGHAAIVRTAAFSPDGLKVVTAGYDRIARIWDASTGKELVKLEGHAGWAGAAFSPDGRQVVTACQDGIARVWDTASGKELVRFVVHSSMAVNAAFSPDGLKVVTASDDGIAQIWDIASRKELARFETQGGEMWAASFSSDGQRLVTASQDGVARIWDIASHRELAKLEAHAGIMRNAKFSPDDKRVVTVGQDGTAHLWPSWIWEPIDDWLLSIDAGRSFTCEERRRLLHEDCQDAIPVVAR